MSVDAVRRLARRKDVSALLSLCDARLRRFVESFPAIQRA